MKEMGIYKLVNKINGKIYIGKSVNLFHRLSRHKMAKNNQVICRAIKKYGWENFEVEILQDYLVGEVSNEALLALETAFIEFYNSTDRNIGYNLCFFASDRTGISCSQETKEKIRQANLGKKLSKETKKKISLSGKGRDMSFMRRPIQQINSQTKEVIKIWSSATEASQILNINRTSINKVCQNKLYRKTAYGFQWEYVS